MELIPGVTTEHYLVLSLILFCLGIFGILYRRNAILMFMCVELMLNASNLALVAFSRMWGDTGGQVFVFFIMVVAAAEVAVGLAILMLLYRNMGTTQTDVLNKMKW
ncbi:MAG: NADH-quinone oxidoreductase subunit NuoK [Flavobacteriales bacterium]|jgi:NADH-quinone oxidoreductase subunit K